MKKTGIILLIVILTGIAIALINLLVLAISNKELNWFMFMSSKEIKKDEYIRKKQEIELSNLEEIEVNLKTSDINIFLTQESKIRVVEYSYKKLQEDQLFKMDTTSSKLIITEEKRPSFHFFYFNQKAFDIYLPMEYVGKLKIVTVSGNIETQDSLKLKEIAILTTSGDIKAGGIEVDKAELETVSGDIDLPFIKTELIKLKTISGNITAQTVQGKVEAKTTSGDIKISEMQGTIEAKTVSGNIKCKDFRISEDSHVKTTSGDIKLYLNSESNCEMQTKTVSGDVKFPKGRNVMGTEPYAKLTLETVSGNIKLEE